MSTVMDLDFIDRLDRLICTGDVARAGWVIDQDAVIEALETLEIHVQVRIRFMTGKYRRGTHYNAEDHHKITLDQNRPIDNANFFLWHELAHAMQSEKWSRETGLDRMRWHELSYIPANGAWGESYKGNYYEIEANRIADENQDVMLLAKVL